MPWLSRYRKAVSRGISDHSGRIAVVVISLAVAATFAAAISSGHVAPLGPLIIGLAFGLRQLRSS